MPDIDPELFSVEFRHDLVMNFVKGLMEGSIKLASATTDMKEEVKDSLVKGKAELLVKIEKYVSGTLKGEELSKLESEIFLEIGYWRVTNLIEEKISMTQLEKEIVKLHDRIDNTNTILIEILKILNYIGNKIDK